LLLLVQGKIPCGVIVDTVSITMAKHRKYIAPCVMIDIYYMTFNILDSDWTKHYFTLHFKM